jgi:transposase-like protein
VLDSDQIISLYNSGHSCGDIAKIDGRSRVSIYNCLCRHGVPLRSRSVAAQKVPLEVVVKLYNMGLSATQVGRLVHIAASSVVRRLRSNGFTMRSRSVASRIAYSNAEIEQYFVSSGVLSSVAGDA